MISNRSMRQPFEMDSSWFIEAAARRQKWIDQTQSLNLYIANPSGKKLDALYRLEARPQDHLLSPFAFCDPCREIDVEGARWHGTRRGCATTEIGTMAADRIACESCGSEFDCSPSKEGECWCAKETFRVPMPCRQKLEASRVVCAPSVCDWRHTRSLGRESTQ